MINWYLQREENSDVVISTRIRLARNLTTFKFNIKDKEESLKLEETISKELPSLGYGLKLIKLRELDEVEKKSLVEKNLISPDFINREYGDIIINDDENICIMINGEDHINLQVFSSSLHLEEAMNLAVEIDEKMQKLYPIAKNAKYGFLNSMPTNIGTGMRASVMLHLPGLSITGNLEKVLDTIGSFGVEIRGIYGENTKAEGNIYQISNKQTLGISEKDIINNLKILMLKLVEQERIARKYLTQEKVELEDMVYRDYGILTNCRKLTYSEATRLLSNVKLGVDLGIIQELNDLQVAKMYLYSKPANLQIKAGQTLNSFELNQKRAEIMKQIANGQN